MLFSSLIFPFTLNFNSLLLLLQFFFFPLLSKIIFFAQICNCVTSTSTTFLLWFHFLLLFVPLPFLCSVFRLSKALFLISAAFALSAVLFSFSTVSSASASFFGYFFQSLFHLTQITFNSTCFLFVFHLCFKFLAQQCVSFSNSILIDFESGKLRAIQIVCNFTRILPLEMFTFLYLKGSSTKIS